MVLWRICRAARARTAFDGEGARRNPGRWNHKGIPLVYAASSLALAALEMFVHVDPDDLPDDLVAIRAELPEHVAMESVEATRLPRNWRRYPGSNRLQDLGTEWVSSSRTVALIVPSAVIPAENNVLLNPRHPDIQHLAHGRPQRFAFDPRMRKP